MDFMRIITNGAENAYFNMALDEAISESVRQKQYPPTLRLYQWDRPSVSIGYFQKISEVDTDYCSINDYPVVRRLTGGRAILHDSELTYSLSSLSNSHPFNGNLIADYKTISSALVRGLKLLGIEAKMSFVKKRNAGHRDPACFKAASYGEVTVDSRKIIGSAQKRYTDGFLQHGSILFGLNPKELGNVLKNSNDKDFNNICSISDYAPDKTIDDLLSSLKEAFEREFRIKIITDKPSKLELKRAKELELGKYAAPEWNFRR